jgi:hypothetical protein
MGNQLVVDFMIIFTVRGAAWMPIIDRARAGATCRGSEGTGLASYLSGIGDCHHLQAVNPISPDFTNSMLFHCFEDLVPLKNISLTKVLNPKQKVAIDAPTSSSSKSVKCSIL